MRQLRELENCPQCVVISFVVPHRADVESPACCRDALTRLAATNCKEVAAEQPDNWLRFIIRAASRGDQLIFARTSSGSSERKSNHMSGLSQSTERPLPAMLLRRQIDEVRGDVLRHWERKLATHLSPKCSANRTW